MSDAGIEFGDIALVINSNPTRGCIVAIEEADVVVLWRYVIVSGIPHFLAENPTSPELSPAWNTDVQGVLWGLIKMVSRHHPCHSPESKGNKKYVRSSKERQAWLSRSNPDWPKPPTGHQLNEPQARFQAAGSRRTNAAGNGRRSGRAKSGGQKV